MSSVVSCSAEDDPEMSLLDDSVWRAPSVGVPGGLGSLPFSPALLARRSSRPGLPGGGTTCTVGTCSTCQLQGRGDEGASGPAAGGVSGSGPPASVGTNIW